MVPQENKTKNKTNARDTWNEQQVTEWKREAGRAEKPIRRMVEYSEAATGGVL